MAGFARFAGSGFGSGFDEFWAGNGIELPVASEPQVAFAEFRLDPETHPLTTPTGKIEIFSSTIDRYGYPDCPGHPVWLEPEEWLGSVAAGRFSLQLVANQPRSRLHSQLDVGASSQSVKIAGHEPVRMHPSDAEVRGLRDGNLVRIFNDRGACLAGLSADDAVRPRVVQLSTGAWYDPDPADPGFSGMGTPTCLPPTVRPRASARGVRGSWRLWRLRRIASTTSSGSGCAQTSLKQPDQPDLRVWTDEHQELGPAIVTYRGGGPAGQPGPALPLRLFSGTAPRACRDR